MIPYFYCVEGMLSDGNGLNTAYRLPREYPNAGDRIDIDRQTAVRLQPQVAVASHPCLRHSGVCEHITATGGFRYSLGMQIFRTADLRGSLAEPTCILKLPG